MKTLACCLVAGALICAVGTTRPRSAAAQGALDTLGGAVEKGTKDAVKESIDGATGKAAAKGAAPAAEAAKPQADDGGAAAAGDGADNAKPAEKAEPADGD